MAVQVPLNGGRNCLNVRSQFDRHSISDPSGHDYSGDFRLADSHSNFLRKQLVVAADMLELGPWNEKRGMGKSEEKEDRDFYSFIVSRENQRRVIANRSERRCVHPSSVRGVPLARLRSLQKVSPSVFTRQLPPSTRPTQDKANSEPTERNHPECSDAEEQVGEGFEHFAHSFASEMITELA